MPLTEGDNKAAGRVLYEELDRFQVVPALPVVTVKNFGEELTPEQIAFAKGRQKTIFALLGAAGILVVAGVAIDVGLNPNSIIKRVLTARPSTSTVGAGAETDAGAGEESDYHVVSNKEAVAQLLTETPYRVVHDPRLETDKGYTVISKPAMVDINDPPVEVSDNWKVILSSVYTGKDCASEVKVVMDYDSVGTKAVANFLLEQMRVTSWNEADFAIRMGLLAMNLDPSIREEVLAGIVFLDARWQEQRNEAEENARNESRNKQQPANNPAPQPQSEYVLSAPSETPADPEQLKEDLKNRKELKQGRISFGFTLIGPVEYARVLASRAGIIPSLDQVAGTGATYEITGETNLNLSFGGLPVKYLQVKVIAGPQMSEGILWVVSATDMRKGDKFLGWRVAAVVTG